jgi:hypothetical protein
MPRGGQNRIWSGDEADRSWAHQDAGAKKCATGRSLPDWPLNMIIISESSAEATQPVRTSRYPPTHRPSSTACNDTAWHANARPISVHTEEVTGSIPVSPTKSAP